MAFSEILLTLLSGFGYTVLLFIITLAVSMPFGLLISFGSRSKIKPIKAVSRGFFAKRRFYIIRFSYR